MKCRVLDASISGLTSTLCEQPSSIRFGRNGRNGRFRQPLTFALERRTTVPSLKPSSTGMSVRTAPGR